MLFKVTLTPNQFGAFLTRMRIAYPDFRTDTGGIPVYRVQIAKNDTHVQIKAIGGYTLPPDVEETAVRILAEVQADKELAADAEIRWSDIARQRKRQAVPA